MSKFYGQNPGLANASFDRQMDERFQTMFGMCDFYSQALRGMGHEARDVILNLEPAQKAWAREHGVSYNEGARRNFPISSADHRPATWMRRICNSRFMRPHLRELCDAEQVILSFSIIRAKSELAGRLLAGKRFFGVHPKGSLARRELQLKREMGAQRTVRYLFPPGNQKPSCGSTVEHERAHLCGHLRCRRGRRILRSRREYVCDPLPVTCSMRGRMLSSERNLVRLE